MQTLVTAHGPVEFPDRAVEAIGAHAVFQAEMAAAVLDAVGFLAQKPVALPRSVLLELGAVLELGTWQAKGLLGYLAADLPSFEEAWSGLVTRMIEAPKSFFSPDAEVFSRRMLAIWFERLAWDAPELLGADVVLDSALDPAMIDELAQFLFDHGAAILPILDTFSLESHQS